MLKDDELIGNIDIYRQEVRPFTDKQIELRRELRRPGGDRYRERAPVRRVRRAPRAARVAAAADCHRRRAQVIASSPETCSRCLNPSLENATRFCQAEFGNLFLREGEASV